MMRHRFAAASFRKSAAGSRDQALALALTNRFWHHEVASLGMTWFHLRPLGSATGPAQRPEAGIARHLCCRQALFELPSYASHES